VKTIYLSAVLWQHYTQFCLLWRKTGGVALRTDVCGMNGIAEDVLEALGKAGAIAYGKGVERWWPVRDVRVEVMVADLRPAHRRNGRKATSTRDVVVSAATGERMRAKVVKAAGAEGVTVSAWVRDAISQKLGAGR
jgi:hypothetical protein